MDDKLRIQVLFAGIDKLTAPLRAITAGSGAAQKALSGTTRELANLRRAQVEVAKFKTAEARLKSTSAELETAKNKTAELRKQIEAVDTPTKKMSAAFAKAEAAERAATERHEKQGSALQDLSRKLQSAGVGIDDLAGHEERLAERVKATTRTLEQQREHADRLARNRERGERLKSAGGKIAGAGAALSVGVTAPAVALLGSSMEAAKESRQAIAQVNASLASNGTAAGRSSAQLADFAGKLQDISLFDDDDILKSVTANMLTFGSIAGKNFDEAQLAAVNLSAKLGQDLQSSTIQVGKALNDPIKGITALRRVGIQFTEDQKDQIKAMVAHKNVAGAQALILKELNKEFGGSAAAQRAASPDGAAQQAWRTFQETVGDIALKLLPPLTRVLTQILNGFTALDPSTQTFLVAALAIGAALGPLLALLGSIVVIVGGVAAAFSVAFLPALGIVAAVVAVIGLLAYGAYEIYTNWGAISTWFSGLWAGVMRVFNGFVADLKTAWDSGLVGVIALLWKWRGQLLSALASVLVLAFSGAFTFLTQTLPSLVWTVVSTIGQLLWTGLTGLAGKLYEFGANTVKGFVNGMKGQIPFLNSTMKQVSENTTKIPTKHLKIQSPSRVFMAIGGHVVQGLAIGIQRGSGAPLAHLGTLSQRMTAAMAGSALALAPASATSAGGTGLSRPTTTRSPAGGAPGRAIDAPRSIHIGQIVIKQQPGEDAAALAKRVREEIKRLDAGDRRSSFEDDA